jgi:hypothetical protein
MTLLCYFHLHRHESIIRSDTGIQNNCHDIDKQESSINAIRNKIQTRNRRVGVLQTNVFLLFSSQHISSRVGYHQVILRNAQLMTNYTNYTASMKLSMVNLGLSDPT